jgi:hypothetical protein
VRDQGITVVESPPYVVHQFHVKRDLWSVVVPDDEALTEALVRALVATQLPPEESPAEQVAHADNLYGVRVTRSGDQLSTISLWGVSCDHYGCDPAVLVRQTADDRSYEVGSYDELQQALWTDEPEPENPFGEGVLVQPVASLDSNVDALVGGGDGATILPFEWVARNGVAERVEEPRRAQISGAVVLADGRLLAALNDGLWISDGDDWTRYAPYRATFEPPLATAKQMPAFVDLTASVDPDPVIWAEDWRQRVYVSTDGRSFTELRLR